MLNPVQLQALAEVVRTGSFSEAGKELGYTASAVSQQVTALERAVGLRLVVRGPHRILCTDTARRLADRGQQVLRVLSTLEDDVRALARGQAGQLRIGTSLGPMACLIGPSLRDLKTLHPQVELVVTDHTSEELVERVRVGSVDVGLVYDYPAAPRSLPDELASVELTQEPWQLVTPADWPDGHALADLAAHPWVVGLDRDIGSRALSVVCATAGFTPRISATSRNHDVVIGLVSAGPCVGVLPAARWSPSPDVTVRPFDAVGATRRTLAVHLRGRTDTPVSCAIRTLRRTAEDGRGTGEREGLSGPTRPLPSVRCLRAPA